MPDHPPTSVLLPTTRWTDACEEVADQLRPVDELLIIHDDDGDPVAGGEDLPAGVRLVAAGEPDGCSGKANAIDAGMAAATHDRLVWTDDDFRHPPDWLATLRADYETHGPVSEAPFFVGRDPLSVLLEPTYVLGGTLGAWAGDKAWGGSVTFERSDLDEAAFRRELRRTVSDDGILSEHLDLTTLRRTRTVPVGGSLRDTLERHVRWVKVVRRHEPRDTAVSFLVGAVVAALAVLYPLVMAPLLTAGYVLVYAAVGRVRWTALLAYPASLAQVPLLAYALARRTFVWGGRRYRWPSKFDVEVLE